MTMNSATRLAIVWLLLSLISAASLLVGGPAGSGLLEASTVVTVSVIVIALVKVRIIMREFMEVRHAPPLLNRLTDLWLALTGTSLLGIYLFGAGAW